MFVFRIAKGRDGGSFSGECPIDFKTKFESIILNDLHKINVGQIPYETNNYIDYLHRELWQSGKLRQGWGIEGLNLSNVLDDEDAKSEWIKHYIIGLKNAGALILLTLSQVTQKIIYHVMRHLEE